MRANQIVERERKKAGRWWSELLHLHSRTTRRVSVTSQPGRRLVWNLDSSSLLAVTSHVSNFSNSKKVSWLVVKSRTHSSAKDTGAGAVGDSTHTKSMQEVKASAKVQLFSTAW